MPKKFKFIVDHWEDELLEIAHDAVKSAIASAYINIEGIDLTRAPSAILGLWFENYFHATLTFSGYEQINDIT
jgi:hypothetical protein